MLSVADRQAEWHPLKMKLWASVVWIGDIYGQFDEYGIHQTDVTRLINHDDAVYDSLDEALIVAEKLPNDMASCDISPNLAFENAFFRGVNRDGNYYRT